MPTRNRSPARRCNSEVTFGPFRPKGRVLASRPTTTAEADSHCPSGRCHARPVGIEARRPEPFGTSEQETDARMTAITRTSTEPPSNRAPRAGARIRAGKIVANLSTAALYEAAVLDGEGLIAAEGPLVVSTGTHTGRSPKDKFIVREPSSEANVWWGDVDHPNREEHYDRLRAPPRAH